MKFFEHIKSAIRDLIYGRQSMVLTASVEPIKVQDVNKQAVTHRSILSQNGENFIILPFEEPELLIEFAEQHPELMFKYLMRRLSKAIRKNSPSIILFQFGNSQKNLAIIYQDKYKVQLDHMMTWFIKTEDYESASVCKTLISQLKAPDAIDQSH